MGTNLTARVTPIENGGNVKGLATIIYENQIAVNGIKVVEGEKGLFVQMPQFKDKEGVYKDIVFPIDGDLRKAINETVLSEFENPTPKTDLDKNAPADFKVDVSLVKNGSSNNVKAGGQIVINDVLVIKNVKVVEGANGLFAGMPNYQDQHGEYQNIAHPVTTAGNEKIQSAVLKKHGEMESRKTIGNSSFKELGGKDELAYRTLNNKFAEKVGKELDKKGVFRWTQL